MMVESTRKGVRFPEFELLSPCARQPRPSNPNTQTSAPCQTKARELISTAFLFVTTRLDSTRSYRFMFLSLTWPISSDPYEAREAAIVVSRIRAAAQ